MCDAGRIRHHLRHNLGRPECSVIFAGFQAEGTLGRRIVDGAKRVGISGDDVAVNARIHTINGFSAHADRGELLDWLSAYRGNPTVFVTHGEEQAAFAFAEGVRSRFGFTTHVPARGDVHEL